MATGFFALESAPRLPKPRLSHRTKYDGFFCHEERADLPLGLRAVGRIVTAPLPDWLAHYLGPALLISIAGLHAVGAYLDAVMAINYPFEISYGEGVVWQQALLIPGPRFYSADTGLPFIVFHYPPVYHLVVHAIGLWTPDLLMAGRIVSTAATGVFAAAAGGVVFSAAGGRITWAMRVACAVVTALLVLVLPNIRSIGFLMRVDMVANALGPIALLIAFTGRPGLARTTAALTIATLAVFTKQTEVAAGLTIFTLLVRIQPRQTILAALMVGGAGLATVAVLQWFTQGGFLQHIVTYNLNRSDWAGWAGRVASEWINLPLIGAVFAILAVCVRHSGGGLGPDRSRLSFAIILFFGLNLLSLVGLAKSGAAFNYLNSLYGAGSMVVGIGLAQLLSAPRSGPAIGTALVFILAGWIAVSPIQRLGAFLDTEAPERQAELVRMIAATEKPVASDDLVLVLRAGRTVLFEPAIATELAITGRWDERPLVDLINRGGVAFAISEIESLDDSRRSPGVLAAMQAAFPRTRQITSRHWLHER